MTEATETIRDDKNTVTDIAFGVDKTLIGKTIATPFQRGVAMLVDAFFVLLLTDVSGVFWGMLAGIAFYKFGKKRNQNNRWRFTRAFVRFIGAFIIFITVLVIIDGASESFSMKPKVTTPAGTEIKMDDISQVVKTITAGGLLVKLHTELENNPNCNYDCYHPLMEQGINNVVGLGVGKEEATKIFTQVIEEIPFDTPEQRGNYQQQVKTLVAAQYENQPELAEAALAENTPAQQTEIDELLTAAEKAEYLNSESGSSIEESGYSLVNWTKGIIADLGLGFGWAALYFTAFTALWKGQTPGKRLMGIRVVQLDGTYMSAWDSFGRYGGYGAGFATGLLGFIQIYWDSNRQAIQDKISATVVIKGDI